MQKIRLSIICTFTDKFSFVMPIAASGPLLVCLIYMALLYASLLKDCVPFVGKYKFAGRIFTGHIGSTSKFERQSITDYTCNHEGTPDHISGITV